MTQPPTRVLGLVGSPRRHGNTETLVREVLGGADAAGASVGLVLLPELNIHPCLGCEHCLKHGVCVHDDDLAQVVTKLRESDVWVFGTPVYFFGPSAQFKAFLDRWVGIPEEVYQGKRVAYVIPLAANSEEIAGSTVDILERSAQLKGMTISGGVVAPRLLNLGEAAKDDELLARARELGQAIASR